MNLRVDLILETEKRSASVVNAKGLVRIVSIVVPLIVLVIIGLVILGMVSLKNELKNRETEMAIAGPKRDAAIKFRAELGKNIQALEELEGWRKSRINWCEQLVNIRSVIPAKIQLTSLRIMHGIEPPARLYSIAMRGKAFDEHAKANVEMLGDIKKNAAFSSLLKDSKVASYKRNNDPGVKNGEMLFEIEASYQPRTFK